MGKLLSSHCSRIKAVLVVITSGKRKVEVKMMVGRIREVLENILVI